MIALRSVGGCMIPKALVCVSTDLTFDRSGGGRLTLFTFPTATMAPEFASGSELPFPTESPAMLSCADLTAAEPLGRADILRSVLRVLGLNKSFSYF